MAEDSVLGNLEKRLAELKEEAKKIIEYETYDRELSNEQEARLKEIDAEIKQIETDLRVLQPKLYQIAYETEWKELDEKLRKAKKDLIRVDSIDTTDLLLDNLLHTMMKKDRL